MHHNIHARPQHPIVFIHNISLYFNCISSVKYVFKWSHHGHVMPFSAVWPKQFNVPNQKIEYAYFERQEKCLRIVQNGRFLLFFHISKWWLIKEGMKAIPKDLICKYFICYIMFQFYWPLCGEVVCNAYYCPLLSNFLYFQRSDDDEKQKGGEEEG